MRRPFLLAALLAVATGPLARAGEDAAPPAAVRAARDAVSRLPEFQYGKPKGRSFLEELWDAYAEWLAEFHRAHPVVLAVVMTALGLFLVALVAHIVWTLRTARQASWQGDAADLGAALRRGDPGPFRASAVAHAEAGRFDDAVRDLYAALLLTLDRRGALRYAPHKALVDYRIETARDAQAAQALELFAGTYHPGSFGRRPPDRARFDGLLRALDGLTEPAR